MSQPLPQRWIWFLGACWGAAGCAMTTSADTVRRDQAGYSACAASCRDAAAVRAQRASTDADTQAGLRRGPDTEGDWCRSDCVAEYRPGDTDGMESAETGGVDRTEATLDMPPPPPPATVENE